MNRRDLQRLAEKRIKEAEVLLRAKCYDGAYYLAGYAVECALKACIAKQTMQHDFPDKAISNQAHTHDITKLVGVAGLQRPLDTEMNTNSSFAINWTIVKDWTEQSRYRTQPSASARDLVRAINDHKTGVMAWLRQHW
jgi:HEPN domain-containing protein